MMEVKADNTALEATLQTFWLDTIETEADLESGYLRAQMLAEGSEAEDVLTDMRGRDELVFSIFKCMAEQRCDLPWVKPATNDVIIEAVLINWTNNSNTSNQTLKDVAAGQLQ